MKCIDVTADNYQGVFRAFRVIDYDNGAVNRFEPEMTVYPIPEQYAESLVRANKAILALTEEQLDVFCAGDEDDAKRLMDGNAGLLEASELLNNYFDGPLGEFIDKTRTTRKDL